MKIKIFTILMALAIISSAFSQTNLNNYKYVIVPKKYDFLKEEDEYRLNGLTKFLFEKYGFLTLIEGDNYPDDLLKDRCLALHSNVINDSGFFKTKLKVELEDCTDKVIFTSVMGETREKEFGKAYTEALRNAFISFEAISYKYEPKENKVSVIENQELKKEPETLKQEKIAEVIPAEETKVAAVAAVAVIETAISPSNTKDVSDILYAQATEIGFQLVDSTPKVVYKIKRTSLQDVFLVQDIDGTLFNKDGQWILEYYEQGILKQKLLNIKF
ncbi:hypothetical protein V8G56_04910 [Gaetbulibacter aquiaggeris]|uniref:Secreted protein n=1 Tax=Gaetbulibacter aquiaggeris TaxID=1735373 RepID=A0ABW7MMM4_9FLAO